MHHSEQKCAHFSEWCIVGYERSALWDLWIWSIYLYQLSSSETASLCNPTGTPIFVVDVYKKCLSANPPIMAYLGGLMGNNLWDRSAQIKTSTKNTNGSNSSYVIGYLMISEYINSSPPSAACMRQGIGQALVEIMACHLFQARPSSKPVLEYCYLESWEHTSLKVSSKKYVSFTKMPMMANLLPFIYVTLPQCV